MSEKYDVIIIGAGIGGLTCGCYLAKAGLKVLIAEQHDKPGGYCTSYTRKGFNFDVGPHYLGSLREGGILFQVLKDFDLLDRITFITNDPTDKITTPDFSIYIRKNRNDTEKELILHFPQEKANIESFFKFINDTDFLFVVSKTRNKTFQELLDTIFRDTKLKAILSIPLISIGLPPNRASALASVVLYREFVFDGGYYPQGGMQRLPNLLSSRLKEYGGVLLLKTKVDKIITKKGKIDGIRTDKGQFIQSKFVVSNTDATSTFKHLLDIKTKEIKLVNKLEPSISAFEIYLGLKRELHLETKCFTLGLFSSYNINKSYSKHTTLNFDYLICIFPTLIDQSLAPVKKSILRIFVGTDLINKKIWNESNQENLYREVISKVSNIIPGLERDIEIKEIATPITFNKYTSNKNGAMFGWAATLGQTDSKIFPSQASIENLYLTGHWVTNGIGQSSVSLVAFCGRSTAKLILKKYKR